MKAAKTPQDVDGFRRSGVEPADYETILENFRREFTPKGLIEHSLVEMLAHDVWTRRRMLLFQSLYKYDPAQPVVNTLLDYAAKRMPLLERTFAGTLKQLQDLQGKPAGGAKLALFRQPASKRRQSAPQRNATGKWVN